MEDALASQKSVYVKFGVMAVDEAYMTIEQFCAALKDYKDENSLSDDQFNAIRNGNIELLVDKILGENGEE